MIEFMNLMKRCLFSRDLTRNDSAKTSIGRDYNRGRGRGIADRGRDRGRGRGSSNLIQV